MPVISIPIKRLLFGNEHWRTNRAIDEMEIYCDLLENLEERIDSVETRGNDEEATLINVQAVISSYAIEIALKSLWALDHSAESVPHTHDLSIILDDLKEQTVKSLIRLGLTRKVLEDSPRPFFSNRYSMECGSRDITVYQTPFLRSLIPLLRDKQEDTRKTLLKPPPTPTP